MPPEPTGTARDALSAYIARRGLGRRLRQAAAVNDWEALVGPQLARVTRPESVDRGGTLRVRVESAAWLQELQLMSPTIVRELSRRRTAIERIRWVLGPLHRASGGAGDVQDTRSRPTAPGADPRSPNT